MGRRDIAAPLTVVELPSFVREAERLLSMAQLDALVDHVARNPLDGVLIPGSGGLRKLRWQLAGRGKRGGARVIYFFHDERLPLYLVALYAKNEKADLSAAQRREFAELAAALRRRMRQ